MNKNTAWDILIVTEEYVELRGFSQIQNSLTVKTFGNSLVIMNGKLTPSVNRYYFEITADRKSFDKHFVELVRKYATSDKIAFLKHEDAYYQVKDANP